MRIQYTLEAGVINLDGAHLPDDYIETFSEDEREQALDAYLAMDLAKVRQYYEDSHDDLQDGERVYRALLVESMEDDDPDDYIVESAEFLCEDDGMDEDDIATCPDDIVNMGLDDCIADLKAE